MKITSWTFYRHISYHSTNVFLHSSAFSVLLSEREKNNFLWPLTSTCDKGGGQIYIGSSRLTSTAWLNRQQWQQIRINNNVRVVFGRVMYTTFMVIGKKWLMDFCGEHVSNIHAYIIMYKLKHTYILCSIDSIRYVYVNRSNIDIVHLVVVWRNMCIASTTHVNTRTQYIYEYTNGIIIDDFELNVKCVCMRFQGCWKLIKVVEKECKNWEKNEVSEQARKRKCGKGKRIIQAALN